MTPTEAAALALLALYDRRLISTVIRSLTGRSTADDLDLLPERLADEPLVAWVCRCRGGTSDAARSDHQQIATTAANQVRQAEQAGLSSVALLDPRYPRLLAAISDPPPILWVKGHVEVLHEPAIAIVGSRAATPYGLTMARRLSGDLAAAGVVVTSGLARGVDSAAHLAALSARGRTVGVLGCGLDRVYPPEHKDLAREMEHDGAVVSEFPMGVSPRPHHFPMRNRIISGLSSAVIVVEAPEKSGALITASAALEQGRDVLVVPGPVTGARNRGGHLLIRDGARLVESVDDILGELGGFRCAASGSTQTKPAEVFEHLPQSTDFTVDEVADLTGELPNVVLARLLDLELNGKIQRIGGGRFVRVLT